MCQDHKQRQTEAQHALPQALVIGSIETGRGLCTHAVRVEVEVEVEVKVKVKG